jgi:hypothetical protein
VLQKLGHDEGIKIYGKPKEVTRSSYYRWRKLLLQRSDQDDLEGDYSNRGRKNQLGRGVSALIRRVIAFEIESARYKALELGKPRLTFKSVAQSVLKALDAERLKRPSEKLRFPTESTLRKYWKEVPAYTRAIAMWGPTTARSMFRRPPSDYEEPLAPLSLCQFDETRLPLFVVDEIYLIPIGRPWLAWIVDVFTGGIVGFYLGFDPPSDLVISSTLRHACLFKTYMRTEYPDITAEYLMAGVPRFLTFDNSLHAHGTSIAIICGNLDILWDYQPPRMPWLKAHVEGTFEIANRTVLSEMPGFVLSRDLVDRNDYNPQENACIGFRQLLWLIHRWIVEVYHVLPPETGCKIPPNVRWQQGIKIVEPGYIARSEDLDVLFGIVREGRLLDHRGVSYAGLYYYSEEFDIFRRRHGASTKVRCKVDPLDLAQIYIWEPNEKLWLKGLALERDYARGLSLHLHNLLTALSNRLYGVNSLEHRLRARQVLQASIANAYRDATSIRNLSLAARAIGIGTHSIFNQLDTDGRLAPPARTIRRDAAPSPHRPAVCSFRFITNKRNIELQQLRKYGA